jgi:preprotein translocase SecE subunit
LSLFAVHKPGQARLSRSVTLFSGLFLICWGCRSLMRTISDPGIWPKGGLPINTWLVGEAPSSEGWRVNAVLFEENLSIAFLIGAVVMVALCFWWWRFLNRERWAELLIDMETELRKVSWPTLSDAWQSTLVVTGFTFTVVVTILLYDVVIKGFIDLCVNLHRV